MYPDKGTVLHCCKRWHLECVPCEVERSLETISNIALTLCVYVPSVHGLLSCMDPPHRCFLVLSLFTHIWLRQFVYYPWCDQTFVQYFVCVKTVGPADLGTPATDQVPCTCESCAVLCRDVVCEIQDTFPQISVWRLLCVHLHNETNVPP